MQLLVTINMDMNTTENLAIATLFPKAIISFPAGGEVAK